MAKDLVLKLIVTNVGKEDYSANLLYEAFANATSSFRDI